MKHVPAPAETEPHALHASAVLGDCVIGQVGRALAIAWKRTVAMPVRDDFHFSGASAGSMVALGCLQQPLVEEAVLPLRVTGLLQVMLANIEGAAGDGIDVRRGVALCPVFAETVTRENSDDRG